MHELTAAHWRTFWNLSIDMKCLANFDGYFLVVNPAFERTLGYTEAELLGRPFLDFVHPDDREATLAKVATLANGGDVISFENRYRSKSRGWVWLDWVSRPVVEEGLIYATARDITDRMLLQTKLAEKVQELEASNRELDAFAYAVSHDLRAPLRSIDGFSASLLQEYSERLDDRGRDRLQRVRAAAQRMGFLIDDMLMLSRMTRADLHKQHVDLSALARSIATELSNTDGRGVQFEIAPALSAWADPRLLGAVMQNLLSNAWKFTSRREVGHIEVGRQLCGSEHAFFVRDNGAGFDMAYADKLFAPFQRLHSASEFPGNGIGLATVQRILSRHGGRIWAEGAVDQGATFYFVLPEEESN